MAAARVGVCGQPHSGGPRGSIAAAATAATAAAAATATASSSGTRRGPGGHKHSHTHAEATPTRQSPSTRVGGGGSAPRGARKLFAEAGLAGADPPRTCGRNLARPTSPACKRALAIRRGFAAAHHGHDGAAGGAKAPKCGPDQKRLHRLAKLGGARARAADRRENLNRGGFCGKRLAF